MAKLTIEELRESLFYNPMTGVFIRLKSDCKNPDNARVGKQAGSFLPNGTRLIRINGKRYQEHRLAWFYIYGKGPIRGLDHKNLVKSDNRIDNLREATPSQNMHNMNAPRHNSSGIKGVCFDRANNRWMAYIQVNGKFRNLGRYDSKEEAQAAQNKAGTQIFGEFFRPSIAA